MELYGFRTVADKRGSAQPQTQTDTAWQSSAEDYIPDGLAEKIIDAMEKIPGMKFADNLTGEYAYERKGSTNIVCEMLVLEFSRGRKKCANG